MNQRRSRHTKAVLLLALVLVFAMSYLLFKVGCVGAKEWVLASELQVVLLRDGQPMRGAAIVRDVSYTYSRDDRFRQVRRTDSTGTVTFAKATMTTYVRYFIEFHSRTRIGVTHEGETVLLWSTKTHGGDLGEFKAHAVFPPGRFKLVCELTRPLQPRLGELYGKGRCDEFQIIDGRERPYVPEVFPRPKCTRIETPEGSKLDCVEDLRL